MHHPAASIPPRPALGQHRIEEGGAERTRKMIAPLAPVEAAAAERPARLAQLRQVDPETGDEAFAYPGEQCGVVLTGVAEVTLYDTVHRLRAGDSIRFDCSVPHRIVNPGRRELRCIWAIIPPTF